MLSHSGGHKGPDIMAINPRGQVPTFSDKGTVVNESLAILLYLEDAYPEPSLMPGSAKGRALVCMLMPCPLADQTTSSCFRY